MSFTSSSLKNSGSEVLARGYRSLVDQCSWHTWAVSVLWRVYIIVMLHLELVKRLYTLGLHREENISAVVPQFI